MSLDADAAMMVTGWSSSTVVWRSASTRGLFDESGEDVVMDGVGQPVRLSRVSVTIATADVPTAAAVGDTITIDGTSYTVREWFVYGADGRTTRVVVVPS